MLDSCLAYSSALKMVTGSSGTSANAHGTTRRHIPEDTILHNHRCENLKSDLNDDYYHVGLTSSWENSPYIVSNYTPPLRGGGGGRSGGGGCWQ
jgi:hypothetical protein